MAGGGDGAAEYVSREVLERLVDDLTVEDWRRAQDDYPEGSAMRGFGSVYHAAVRLHVVNGDEDAREFLARVRIRDLAPIMEAATASLPQGQTGGESSRPSAGSGG